ncbi:hypothetical protein [Aquirufa rosea]|uniref:Uncharacterized protein n=1 Tax=Aquirufa rosea TaxID=2509241 RepID=A0A4Q1BZU1_9BACT|nr:hypothetical protein [Aquirufa rosea]RXK49678.1 hypothetical protein ESB04_05750 [Aquirufa rosea]
MILVGAIVQVYLPWYTMGMAFGIISYLLLLPSRSAFVVGGGAGFILWALAAIWMDKQFPSTLPGRMAQLLPLGGSVMALYLLTGVFGGLTGALWSWAGSKLRGSH